MTIKVGDTVPVWWQSSGRVIAVRPYDGKYTELFTHILTIDAPNTRKGSLDMAYKDDETCD